MRTINGDEPAAPVHNNRGYSNTGLSKREHFAGLALQGLCAGSNMLHVSDTAELAVGMADALLAELSKTEEA